MARVFYCSIDPSAYFPEYGINRWDLGYLGTYSGDRQPRLQELLVAPAVSRPSGRFIVAGAQYPDNIDWPENIERVEHLPPQMHRNFYNAQRFTLNITRADMIKAGYSPSIRLFEAAACATPIVSDYWPGLESIFRPDEEILVAESAEDVLRFLRDIPGERRSQIGWNARRRVLREHTARHRVEALERYILESRHKTSLGKQVAS
jgi:spore maturation protein CgeB